MMKSAEQGYIPAETMIGCTYLDNHITDPVPNYADAERWLRAAATQGDAEAQLWLGIGYDREYFGRIDYQESLKWLRKSSAITRFDRTALGHPGQPVMVIPTVIANDGMTHS
jgi:TPR repeat protein